MISYKIVLVGDFGAGKTSLIKRYVDNTFSEEYKSSIGVSISKKILEVKIDDILYETTMMIWDIEGKTDFKPIFHHHLNGSKGFVVVADLTRQTTIDSIQEHIKLCKTICKDAPIVLALNKIDLYSNNIDLDALKDSFDEEIIGIFKTSAKNTSYVKELFDLLNLEIVKSIKK
ncbi:Rab family GTPase [Aliarcobacter cryaerophilus]|uniref:GTP-binding protein n=1 Tax=Aliarcobacter cryaerophilus TaxID=28198 RepID=A0A2S9TCV6_9BACT|nr:Rab family GTPase [Aliarcobacter cryaerophilus]PRM96673.1 GTP-binding protein [Arcobacter cryaerophilus gv. crypticus]